jgi:hypothetical protein
MTTFCVLSVYGRSTYSIVWVHVDVGRPVLDISLALIFANVIEPLSNFNVLLIISKTKTLSEIHRSSNEEVAKSKCRARNFYFKA